MKIHSLVASTCLLSFGILMGASNTRADSAATTPQMGIVLVPGTVPSNVPVAVTTPNPTTSSVPVTGGTRLDCDRKATLTKEYNAQEKKVTKTQNELTHHKDKINALITKLQAKQSPNATPNPTTTQDLIGELQALQMADGLISKEDLATIIQQLKSNELDNRIAALQKELSKVDANGQKRITNEKAKAQKISDKLTTETTKCQNFANNSITLINTSNSAPAPSSGTNGGSGGSNATY